MGTKMSFELDAGKILAKLHRGACQTHANFKFFNTGITDDANLTPEQVDKNKINFDMDGGEYEVGLIFDEQFAIDLKTSMKEVADDAAEESSDDKKKDSGKKGEDEGAEDEEPDEEVNKNTTITDNPADGKKDLKEAIDWHRVLNEDVTKIDPNGAKNPEGKDANKEINNAVGGAMAAIVTGNLTDPADAKAVGDAVAEVGKKAGKAAEQAVKKNYDAVKKLWAKAMDDAATYLTDYMKVFAGEDGAKGITADKLAVTYVPDGKNDPFKIKKYDKYQIPALTDEQVRQYKIDQLKKDPDATEISLGNVCFKVAYSLDIGK